MIKRMIYDIYMIYIYMSMYMIYVIICNSDPVVKMNADNVALKCVGLS